MLYLSDFEHWCNLNGLKYESPQDVNDLRPNSFYVYLLFHGETAIICGKGKKIRAKVIFDRHNGQLTKSHIKSLMARVYSFYGSETLSPRVIECSTDSEAKRVEALTQKKFGGNSNVIPTELKEQMFEGLERSELTHLFLNQALLSSFSGIGDLYKWRKASLIEDQTWLKIKEKLAIPD